MGNNEILDEHLVKKRFSGKWMGAKYFGLGVAIGIVGFAITFGLDKWLGTTENRTLSSIVIIFALLGGMAFLFFNATGAIMSLTYLVAGKNRDEKFAGLISLLLNLSPYLVLLTSFLAYSYM